MIVRTLPVVGVALLVFALLFSVGRAQTEPPTSEFFPPITTGLPQESVAASGRRSPGIMVTDGVARSQSAIDLTRTQSIDITETADTEDKDFRELFVEGAVDIILGQIEDLLFYFTNLLLERAGLPPIEPGNDNGNANTNDNDNANDNDNDNTNNNDNGNDNDNGNANDNDNTNDNDNSNVNDNTNGNVNQNTNSNDNTAGNSNTNTNDNSGPTRPGGVRKSSASSLRLRQNRSRLGFSRPLVG